MRAFLRPQGARLKTGKGTTLMAMDLIGKTGVVVDLDDCRPGRDGVALDSKARNRSFVESDPESIKDI
jgi:hypothetical protein